MTSSPGHAARYGETSLEMSELLMNGNNRNCDRTDGTDSESGEDDELMRELKPMLETQFYDVRQSEATEQDRRKGIANFIEQKELMDNIGNHATTQSFGDVEFVGFGQNIKKSPYIRVDNNTEPCLIWDMLIRQWKMDVPKVLISVTGGAHDYHFKSRLKSLFKNGLIKAAASTGAWIITRGIDVGVSKIVGEAMKEENQGVVALGMASWDNVDNNAALHGHSSEGKWPAKYRASELRHDKPALDCNHTHFILMDNHGRGELGYQIDLRDNLEQFIAEYSIEDGEETHHIPVVLVVIGGATKTIAKVYKCLVPEDGQPIPVVVVDGSGRAADLIAKALRITEGEPTDQIGDIIKDNLTEDIRKVFLKPTSVSDVSAVNTCIDKLTEIVDPQNRVMITVFDMHTSFIKDIDRAILCGLLKAKHVCGDIKAQLNLAMRLDRCDIAKDEIITAGRRKDWQNLHFEENMTMALVHNKVDFVALFLEHVIQLDTFLTIPRLHALYKNVIKAPYAIAGRLSTKHILKRLLRGKEDKVYLQEIGRLCQKFLEDEYDLLYKDDKYLVDTSTALSLHSSKNADFEHPDKDLLIWALLTNRREMANMFWRRLSIGNIGSALIAARILAALAKQANIEESTLTLDLEDHANVFVELAIGVIDQCYEANKRWAQLALVRKLSVWGNTTCLSIAYSAQQMYFLEHECCQAKMERTWKGMVQMNLFEQKATYWIALFCPFLVPTVTFHALDYKELLQRRKQKAIIPDRVKKQPVKNILFRRKSVYPKNIENRRIGGRVDDVTLWEGLHYLYTAPKSKFIWNLVAYSVMLLLFSWFLLTDLRPASLPNSPGTIEYIVMVWIGTLIVEEFRQVIGRDPNSMKYKLKGWYSESWNKFDLVMFLLYIVAVVLRFTLSREKFEYARIVYSVSLMLFYFRLLHMALVAQNIGPKIIMIFEMLHDLLHFVVILVIFLLSFGFATQALLSPNQEPHISVIWHALYRPHWQLYGWLFLDEIEDAITNETCHNDDVTVNGTMVCVDTDMYGWFIPLLTAIYLLIANILLINLLIAMFSYTFQNVQDNSQTIWRFFRCQVIAEYFERPTLAPPFIIFSHIYRIVKFAYHKMKLSYDLRHPGNRTKQEIKNEDDKRQSHALKVCLDEKEEHYINSFERRCMEKYFIKLHQESVQSMESTVSSNADKLEEVIQKVEELQEAVDKEDVPMATEHPPGNSATISTQSGRTDTEEKLLQLMAEINERLIKLEENRSQSDRLV